MAESHARNIMERPTKSCNYPGDKSERNKISLFISSLHAIDPHTLHRISSSFV